jgi:hypothetical protein
MAAAPTYDLISATTVPTTTSYVQLTSFSGYTDLVLVFDGVGNTSGNDLLLRMNNDSSTLYSRPNFTSLTSTYVGRRYRVSAGYSVADLNARVNVTMVYNRELSDAEISQNYDALRGRYGI